MHDYVVAISHRDGDHVGSVKVSAASASDAADAGILTMIKRRAAVAGPERLPGDRRSAAPARTGLPLTFGSAGRPTASPADPSP